MDGKNHLASAWCHLMVKGSLWSHLHGKHDLTEALHLSFHKYISKHSDEPNRISLHPPPNYYLDTFKSILVLLSKVRGSFLFVCFLFDKVQT